MPSGSEQPVVLRPRDPIVVRDARPFTPDPGARAMTLDWPLPTTIAGALRTHIGNALGFDWGKPSDDSPAAGPRRAAAIEVHGPLLLARRAPERDWTVYFPRPHDAIPYDDDGTPKQMRLRPWEDLAANDSPVAHAGSNLPLAAAGLVPVRVTADVKPEHGVAYWSAADTCAWLAQPDGTERPVDALGPVPRETRTHVAIQPGSQTHVEGALFSTTALVFNDATRTVPAEGDRRERTVPELAVLCRVDATAEEWTPTAAFLPLGGERRLAQLLPARESGAAWPAPSEELIAALEQTERLRLQFVTPALFERGWLPDWLDEATLTGTPPIANAPRLTLVSAVVDRRVPVSGWNLQRNAARATRYAAPAGSVYFFRVASGALSRDVVVDQLWLRPVSDQEDDRRNGFGLVVPGVW